MREGSGQLENLVNPAGMAGLSRQPLPARVF